MFSALAILAAVSAPFLVGTLAVRPADILDGRAIAGGTGEPIVMLTLKPALVVRLKTQPATVTIDGKPVQAVIAENTIQITGSQTFEAAAALAKRLSGKDPLPDSLEE